MANDCAIVSDIGPVLVDDLYAIPVEVKDSSIEVAVEFIPACGGSIRPASSGEGGRVEVSNCGPAVGSKCNVCSASSYTGCCQFWSSKSMGMGCGGLPRSLLAEEEVGITDSKADLAALLSEVAIAKRLESSKKEGRRSWQVRDCEANAGDGHSNRR